jgi:hypothetical protein
MLIDPKTRLADVLSQAQEYLDLAVQAEDRPEREFYKRMVDLYLRIAHELESMSDQQLR